MLKQALDNSRLKRQLLNENQENNYQLSERIDALEEKLNLIIQKLETVEKGSNKMESHIDFINDIYFKVQIPLFWICDRVNYMMGSKIPYNEKQNVKTISTINDQD